MNWVGIAAFAFQRYNDKNIAVLDSEVVSVSCGDTLRRCSRVAVSGIGVLLLAHRHIALSI